MTAGAAPALIAPAAAVFDADDEAEDDFLSRTGVVGAEDWILVLVLLLVPLVVVFIYSTTLAGAIGEDGG